MAGIGVSEAARMVGRDVSTLHRMMKTATEDDALNAILEVVDQFEPVPGLMQMLDCLPKRQ